MSNANITVENIEAYLTQHQRKELLRFVAVGSVDDGKSTLIGRLLHDTKGIYEDQLNAVKRASTQGEMEIDFSLFTDGLKAEREQGITIDVAYRYFSTDQRKFIIADTPGHVQYTRNMATGASTANLAIILIDARLGVLPQSRRHAYIASLLGIPHLAVAVNKMDLRGYDQKVYDEIVANFRQFAERLQFKNVMFTPISAKLGDNVVQRSANTPWYDGPTLLEFLETVPIASDRNTRDFRLPVQVVVRPNLDYRGFAGEIAAGSVRKGDPILVLPSRQTSTVRSIDTFDGELESAACGQAVTLRLNDEIDVSRGDMLVLPDNLPRASRRVNARVVWMSEKPLDPDKSYLLKHTTQVTRVSVAKLESVIDLETLEPQPAETLQLNDIGTLQLLTHRPLYFDAYTRSRATGSFILIDSMTNNTVGAGMILEESAARADDGTVSGGDTNARQVSAKERVERLGQQGAAIIVDGEGNEALAYSIERALYDDERVATVVGPNDEVSRSLRASATELAQLTLRMCELGVITVLATGDAEVAQLSAIREHLGPDRVLRVTRSTDPAAPVTLDGAPLEAAATDRERIAQRVVEALAERGLFANG